MNFIVQKSEMKKIRLANITSNKKIAISAIGLLISIFMFYYLLFKDFSIGIVYLAFAGYMVSFFVLLINLRNTLMLRKNENIIVEGDTLYVSWDMDKAAGILLIRNKIEQQIDTKTIHNITYDEKTKRIEFLCSGKEIYYTDVTGNTISRIVDFKEIRISFTDWYNPSLYLYIKENIQK